MYWLTRSTLAVAVINTVLCGYAPAQRTGAGESGKVGATLQVRIVLPNERAIDEQVRVDLLGSGGMLITAMLTNSNGMAFFYDVPVGDYRLRVTGASIQDALSGFFFIENRMRNHSETVVVQPRFTQAGVATADVPSVAVVDLNVPKPARKAVDKGIEAFNRGQLDDARKHFEEAIQKHPNYAVAYNFLGMTWVEQKDDQRGQQAFEKAIELNQYFADAYTNLAKLYFKQQKLELCEPLLEKSVAANPKNLEALTYLVQVELLAGKYEEAAANARRVHELPHTNYAIVHFMAARALRARNQHGAAMSEYRLYLQEAPNSKNSSQARQELTQLEKLKP
ncbi:MAG: tetratricopeptide repeat protein [Acidobacteriales bacterium]|nr:tetratricopeptide repeat protein [Terriglobales bacterium]